MEEKQIHPLCEIFPAMDQDQFEDLLQDVAEHGLIDPIEVDDDGLIVDGRHRWLACQEAGCITPFVNWKERAKPGQYLEDYLISKNLNRRHISATERAMIAAKLATTKMGRPPEECVGAPTLSQGEAADKLGVSRGTVNQAHSVQTNGIPSLKELVEGKKMGLRSAVDISRLSPEEQEKAIETWQKGQEEAINKSKIHEADERYTPQYLIEAAREILGDILLDPCSCKKAQELIQARTYWTVDDDGLSQEWRGFNKIWINWPYSDPRPWVHKIADWWESGAVARGGALMALARLDPSTVWYRELWPYVDAMCLLKNRVTHYNGDGECGTQTNFCSVLIYIGTNTQKFLEVTSPLGYCVVKGVA